MFWDGLVKCLPVGGNAIGSHAWQLLDDDTELLHQVIRHRLQNEIRLIGTGSLKKEIFCRVKILAHCRGVSIKCDSLPGCIARELAIKHHEGVCAQHEIVTRVQNVSRALNRVPFHSLQRSNPSHQSGCISFPSSNTDCYSEICIKRRLSRKQGGPPRPSTWVMVRSRSRWNLVRFPMADIPWCGRATLLLHGLPRGPHRARRSFLAGKSARSPTGST